jgi:hypothetical protein
MLLFGKGEGSGTSRGTSQRTKEDTLRRRLLLLVGLSMLGALLFTPAVWAQDTAECPAGTQPYSPSGSGDDIRCMSNQDLGELLRCSGEGLSPIPADCPTSSANSTASSTPSSTAASDSASASASTTPSATPTATTTASGTAPASIAAAVGGSLPATGSPASPLMGVGALMLLAGAGMVSVAIVRRAS